MSPLPCWALSPFEIARLESIFRHGAEWPKTEPEHWISGGVGNHDHDESLSYCWDCATKEIARLKQDEPSGEWVVAGGYGNEGDSTPFCEKCHVRLENTLTRYGCREELRHFLANGFDPDSGDDCCSMAAVVDARGWEKRSWHDEDDEAYLRDLHELGRRILSALPNKANDPTC